ncbi:hypothetical protein [Methylobacterium sp. WCS2018Hpa-22]|uniref:hypothetical protein n=1 Tax=Methylobacterium sp. WCS2018Hpa-22 TaxID=3073633 RepID=UPI00288A2907|nr:hypothetical protein [Methylobacterium sp. WCS2018Hpa-22]
MSEYSQTVVGPVAIICPSLGKACGIARYSSYVAESLKRLGVEYALMTKAETLMEPNQPIFKTILIQHEYGLFDHLSHLGAGETTSAVISTVEKYLSYNTFSRAAIIMHTIVVKDHVLNMTNMQLFSSSIPIFHLNAQGCFDLGIPYLEHGIFTYDGLNISSHVTQDDSTQAEIPRTMASFGLLSPNKRPIKLIDICSRAGVKFIGNFATHDQSLVNDLKNHARQKGVDATIFSDFCEEDVLLNRLKTATIAAVAQDPIKHSATSGSVRFLLNLGIPVIASCVPQFEDCSDALILCDEDSMHEMIQSLTTDSDLWQTAAERAANFVKHNDMRLVYQRFLQDLHSIPTSEFTAYRKRNFRESGHKLILSDLLMRTSKSSEDMAEIEIVSSLSQPVTNGVDHDWISNNLSSLPKSGKVEFRLSRDRNISSSARPDEYLVLASSNQFIASSLDRISDNISVNTSLDARDKTALTRAISKAVKMDLQVDANLKMVRRLAEIVLKTLKPSLYTYPEIIYSKLEALKDAYGSQRGFAQRSGNIASAQVLTALPAKYVITYLYRVAGLRADEILSVLAASGYPNDDLDDRLKWIQSLISVFPRRVGTELTPRRPDPRHFRGRTHFFRTEFACLTNEEFTLAIEQIFYDVMHNDNYKNYWSDIKGSDRRAILKNVVDREAAAGIVIVGMDDTETDIIDSIEYLEMISESHNALTSFMSPINFYYLNVSNISKAHLETTYGINDLFVRGKSLPSSYRPIYYAPYELIRELEHSASLNIDNTEVMDALFLLVFGEEYAGETLESDFWRAPFKHAEELGVPLGILPEPWSLIRKGTSRLNFGGHNNVSERRARLPDQFWEEAWRAVEQSPNGRAIVPKEMSEISPRAISVDAATSPINVNFIVIHKGKFESYAAILSKAPPKHWRVYFSNEVFVILSRRRIQQEIFSVEHIPDEFANYASDW